MNEKFLDYLSKVLKNARIKGNHIEDTMKINVEGPDWQDYLDVNIHFLIKKNKLKEVFK